VRDENVLRLEDAVRKMTSLPAQTLRLKDRGLLKEGYWADVVIFDPATVSDSATYENPQQYAKGVPFVLVNGTLVINDGTHTGARPGNIIYGPGKNSGDLPRRDSAAQAGAEKSPETRGAGGEPPRAPRSPVGKGGQPHPPKPPP